MFILTKNYVIFSLTILSVLTLMPVVSAKICKAIDVRNHVQNLNKLRNCTEITGNLSIVLLENTKSESDYDPYTFPELQKVTEYVVLYKLTHFTSLGKLFPNLRLIRGLTLLQEYALIIYDVPSIREIGTSKLSYIPRGYVKIAKCPKLCYVNTIAWRNIGPNIFVHYQKYNDCPPCPAHCNGHCWSKDQCQIFTDSCHIECLGCTKNNSSAHCEVCKNYENDGICVAKCPPNKYILREIAKCVSHEECLARNVIQATSNRGELWFIYDGECRNDCPIGTKFDATITNCTPCNDCVRYCDGTKVLNQITIQNMYGCTHINGSLSIINLVTKEEIAALYEYFKYLVYIRDYLLIARNELLEDLQFLLKLTEIGGVNLYANKSLFVYENHNLKKLWDINQTFPLKISNGNIGFHDNEQLCLTEIERFAEKAGLKYSETDVSKYSNGAYCHEALDTGIEVNITEVNTKNATIVWGKKYGNRELYYTVHYTDSNHTEERQEDVCGATGWDIFSTANNSAQLLDLKVFTTYSFYIQTHLKTMEVKKSPIKSFKTLPDDPDSPSTFAAYPIDHNSLTLVWTKPLRSNGNLSNYIISIYREDDDPNIVKQRDYCTHPFSDAGAEIDKSEDVEDVDDTNHELTHQERLDIYELGPPELTEPEVPCSPTNLEINIRLEDDVWLYLCDKNSQSKFGVNYCKEYYYDYFSNSSDIQIQKRSGVKTSSRKKSSLIFQKRKFFTETVEANTTNHTIKYLKQFSLYIFYILACNEDYNGRRLCSPVLQTLARTLKNPNADNVLDVAVRVVNQDIVVTWSAPINPNGFIVAYNIYYSKDVEHSNNQTECILQERFVKEKNVTLRKLVPGGYYVMVQAVSLAGPGNTSEVKYVEISDSHIPTYVWLIPVGVIILVVLIGFLIYYYRVKSTMGVDSIRLITQINPDYTTLTYEADEWEMDRNDIELQNMVGHGAFGQVFLGRIKSKNMPCAVKTVTEGTSYTERTRFLNEASTMKEFTNGHHVVKLYGVVSVTQPPLVVMELMERGDLKTFLTYLADSTQTITSNEIYRMAVEIADGLAYLVSRKHVHRDLAARNCMVGTDRTVKIGDFGLARDIYQSDYYKRSATSAPLPVRWMSPEAIADGVTTYDSDIWSYGIVLWEIVTLASQPYQTLSNEEVRNFVVSKGTLSRPAECPNLLWEIMRKCWDWYPSKRPTCFEIIERLQDHVGRDFESLSFYHSTSGQEYLAGQGSVRIINQPALTKGKFQYEDNSGSENEPVSNSELATSQPVDPEFIPPSSPQQAHSSFDVDVDVHELKPLVTRTNSEEERES